MNSMCVACPYHFCTYCNVQRLSLIRRKKFANSPPSNQIRLNELVGSLISNEHSITTNFQFSTRVVGVDWVRIHQTKHTHQTNHIDILVLHSIPRVEARIFFSTYSSQQHWSKLKYSFGEDFLVSVTVYILKRVMILTNAPTTTTSTTSSIMMEVDGCNAVKSSSHSSSRRSITNSIIQIGSKIRKGAVTQKNNKIVRRYRRKHNNNNTGLLPPMMPMPTNTTIEISNQQNQQQQQQLQSSHVN